MNLLGLFGMSAVGAAWLRVGLCAGSIVLGICQGPDSIAKCLPVVSNAQQDGSENAAVELKPLTWMVGEWKSAADAKIQASVSAQWSADGHFLLLDYSVNTPESPAITASDRIAWDPVGKSFRSWTFRADGGFGQANWVAHGGGWIIRYGGTHSDGRQFASTLLLEQGAGGELKLSAVERWIGDEQFPDLVLELRQDQAPTPPAISIEDKVWELVRLESGPIRLPKRPTITLSNQEVSAFGGINQITGGYAKNGDALRFSELVSTLMGGTEEESELEQEFASMLERVTHYTLEGDELILRHEATPIAWFKERGQPAKANFEDARGVTWQLIELKGAAVELEPRPTLRFVEGNVEGHGGVNQMRGTFNQTEDSLSFGPLMSTLRGGPPEAMQLEGNFVQALATVDQFSIEDGKLCLSSANEVVAKFRRQE